MDQFNAMAARKRSGGGRTAYGYDVAPNGTATVYEFRDGSVHRDIGDVAAPGDCGGVEARFTTEQMAAAFCAGLEQALPLVELACDEATEAVAKALEHGGIDGLEVLRENRATAVANGQQ